MLPHMQWCNGSNHGSLSLLCKFLIILKWKGHPRERKVAVPPPSFQSFQAFLYFSTSIPTRAIHVWPVLASRIAPCGMVAHHFQFGWYHFWCKSAWGFTHTHTPQPHTHTSPIPHTWIQVLLLSKLGCYAVVKPVRVWFQEAVGRQSNPVFSGASLGCSRTDALGNGVTCQFAKSQMWFVGQTGGRASWRHERAKQSQETI